MNIQKKVAENMKFIKAGLNGNPLPSAAPDPPVGFRTAGYRRKKQYHLEVETQQDTEQQDAEERRSAI